MVFCSYCGAKNRDGSLKCYNCGKPLRLVYDDPQVVDKDTKLNNNYSENRFKGSIKDNYTSKNVSSLNDLDNHGSSFTTNDSYLNEGTTLYKREYKTNPNRNNNLRNSSLYKNSPENIDNKNVVEWDVVIATALIVIILTAVLNRFLPSFGFFIALLVALIYILIATKNKTSLYKSIPLAIIVILAISSYFSL